MTRSEFREISEWDDLINFCEDNDLEACNEVYSLDDYDVDVCESIKNYVCYNTFFGLVDKLYELPKDVYAVYIKRDEFNWVGSDDRDHLFYRFKEAAENEALEAGVFDEEDYEDPEEIFDEPEDEEPLPEEDFDVFKLTTDTAKLFQQLKEKETEEEKEASAKFASLLGF